MTIDTSVISLLDSLEVNEMANTESEDDNVVNDDDKTDSSELERYCFTPIPLF